MTENEISAEILDAAIAVHNSIGGPGNKKSKTAGHASPTVSNSAEGSHKTLCVLCVSRHSRSLGLARYESRAPLTRRLRASALKTKRVNHEIH